MKSAENSLVKELNLLTPLNNHITPVCSSEGGGIHGTVTES